MLTTHRTQGSKVTLEEHQEIERRLDVFRDWFTKKFLSAPGANTIVVLPIAEAKPNYRDEYPALPTAPTPGLRNTDLSAILGAPELAVPSKPLKRSSAEHEQLLMHSYSCRNPVPVKDLRGCGDASGCGIFDGHAADGRGTD